MQNTSFVKKTEYRRI